MVLFFIRQIIKIKARFFIRKRLWENRSQKLTTNGFGLLNQLLEKKTCRKRLVLFLKKEEALETKASFNIVRSLPSNLLDNPLFQEEQSSFFFLLIEAFCFALGSAIFFVYLKRIYF